MSLITKSWGEVDYSKIEQADMRYIIVHQQAPTSDPARHVNIHPAIYVHYENGVHWQYALWHNGIIKQSEIERLQKSEDSDSVWDTYLLLKNVARNKTPVEINGTFSCLMSDDRDLYIFRNEIAPLFINKDMDISSTKFEGAGSVPPNMMFKLDLMNKKLMKIGEFTTRENPYMFLEDE